jgi:hypothetical protein
MLKFIFFYLAVFLFPCKTFSQLFYGRVLDENKQPLLGASIYFDGTTKGVVTNRNGFFEINIPNNIYEPKLIISYLGYSNLIIKNLSSPGGTYNLERSIEVLNKVNLVSSGFTRKEMEEAFKTHFLGNVVEAEYCKILNLEDIHLYYRENDNTFHAKSLKPIIVENNFLGYKIMYDLDEFFVQFRATSLKYADYQNSFLSGYTLFEDINPAKVSKRKNMYEGSLRKFFLHLIDSDQQKFKSYIDISVKNEKYHIINSGRSYQAEEIFGVEKLENNIYNIFIRSEFVSYKNDNYKPNKVRIIVRNIRKKSLLIFKKPYFKVDSHGFNIDDNVIIKGDMANYKVARMLPKNFGESIK